MPLVVSQFRAAKRGPAHLFWVIALGAGVFVFGAFGLFSLYILVTHRPFRGRDVLAPVFLARMTWVAWRALQRRLQPEHPLANLFPAEPGPADFPRFP